MGRELRKVPANWKHPKNEEGDYIPLLGWSFKKELAYWEEEKKQWDKGYRAAWDKNGKANGWQPRKGDELKMTYEKWDGEKPRKKEYMPEWDESERTHIQLYESTSEGTPLSPVFKADELEKLCEYAAKHCSTFANYKATKKQWMKMLKDDLVYHQEGNVMFI